MCVRVFGLQIIARSTMSVDKVYEGKCGAKTPYMGGKLTFSSPKFCDYILTRARTLSETVRLGDHLQKQTGITEPATDLLAILGGTLEFCGAARGCDQLSSIGIFSIQNYE